MDNNSNNIQPYTIEEYQPNPPYDPMGQQGNNLQPMPQPMDAQFQPYPQDQFAPQDMNPYGNSNQFPMQENGYNGTNNNQQEEKPKRKIPFIPIVIGFVILGIIIFGFLLIKANQQPNNNGNKTPSTGTSNNKVVLQWWGLFLDEDIVQPLIDQYEDLHPNVTIEYADKRPEGTYEAALKEYQNELNRVLTSNDPVQQPDIFMVHNTWAGNYELYSRASTNYDLQKFSDTFYPAVVTDFASSGQVYGTPMWLDSLAIIYNKTLLEEKSLTLPPTRWQEFKNLAESLTVKSGNNMEQGGFSAGTASNVTFAFELFNLLMVQNGVSLTDSNGQPAFSQNPDSVDALEFFKSFISGNESTWNTTFKNDSAEFLEGDLAMTTATSWRLREILRYNDQLNLNLSIGIAQVPQLDGQTQPVINWADYWGNMVSISRPNTSASWDFLNWLSQPEQLKTLSQNVKQTSGYFGIVYPRKDMQNELLGDSYLNVYNESAPNSKSWYMIKGMQVKQRIKELINSGSVNAGSIANAENDIKELISTKGTLQQNELEE